MNLAEIDIDRIVKEVLDDLQHSDPGLSISNNKTEPGQNNKSEQSVRIAGRVITADLLAQKRKQAALIQLEPKAIITPAARDYIQEHGLKITTAISSCNQDDRADFKQESGNWLVITVQHSDLLNSAIDSVSRENRMNWKKEAAGSIEQAAKRAINEIGSGGSGVLIVTDKIATAACLVNRNENVRGVAVRCSHDLSGVKELNANVVCLCGNGLSFTDYRNILKSISDQ